MTTESTAPDISTIPPELLLSLLPPERQKAYYDSQAALAALNTQTPQITLRDLKILNASKQIVPLVANPPQVELLKGLGIDPEDPAPDISEALWRMRLLKARREGFSTLILALYFLDTYNHRERLTVSVAHDQRSAETIFQIVDRYYRHLPEEKKMRTGRANTREYFWPDTSSQFLATTAGVANLYSGGAIHNLHCCLSSTHLIVGENGEPIPLLECMGKRVKTGQGNVAEVVGISKSRSADLGHTTLRRIWVEGCPHSITCTSDHRILCYKDGWSNMAGVGFEGLGEWKQAADVCLGDFLRTPNDSWIPVEVLEEILAPKYVYDLVLDHKDHSYCTLAGVVHNSERAKWPGNAEQINALDASLKGAARWGNIVEETTANGLNFFYDDWMEGKKGKGSYTHLFVPWYMDDRNTTPVRPDFRRTEVEERRVSVYGVNDAQLQWYRDMAEEYGDLLPQEYPYNDLEAFVSSSDNSYFGTAAVRYLMDLIPTLPGPVKVYEASHQFDDHHLHGELHIFEPPITLQESRIVNCPCGRDFDAYAKYLQMDVAICPDCGRENYPLVQYVGGADACSGVGGMQESNPHDWSSFPIYRVSGWKGDWGWKQVAAYHGRPTPRDFGADMAYIGGLYNNCEILVENDPRGYGLQAMERMRELEYPNLRHYNPGSRVERITPPEKQRWGYMVSEKGQLRRDSLLQSAINEVVRGREGIVIQDERAIREMVAYVDAGDGSRGASRGHDDCVAAHGLAHLLLRSVSGGAI